MIKLIKQFLSEMNFVMKAFCHKKELWSEKELSKKRRDICKNCPFNNKKKLPRCNSCGCFIHLKTKLKYVECPEEKW